MASPPLAAVVLAAGRGTRMKAGPGATPKVLAPLLGRPLCAFPVELALGIPADQVVVVIGHEGERVEAALRGLFPSGNLGFAVQGSQLGTADAVLAARSHLGNAGGRILILSGDVPLLSAKTIAGLLSVRAGLAFVTMQLEDPTGYGRVVRNADGIPSRIVEEKDCTPEQRELTEVNAGLYLADAALLWEALGAVGKGNAQGEYYLTDIVALAASRGRARAVAGDAQELRGINDRAELAEAERRLRDRVNRAHMLAGVTMVDPATTYVELPVRIEQDVRIDPGCVITGNTKIAAGAHIRAYSVIEDSTIGPGSIVGPFAHLRPGSVLGHNVHIGNFVETKNTTLDDGAKANHLTYLGDAVVGARANIGAGTITCNYDGTTKNRTLIGEGAFIGSDSQLVAPVRVGAGAYVGAGTTVSEDVPPDSLALSRAPQIVKPGWALKRRERPAPKKS
jgi:bifunctional UDP-N-acetylglucosamine pyrophosphorylase/glucosamine-1-phosphate N-acetyltransferase